MNFFSKQEDYLKENKSKKFIVYKNNQPNINYTLYENFRVNTADENYHKLNSEKLNF